jgi:hypothetical protein
MRASRSLIESLSILTGNFLNLYPMPSPVTIVLDASRYQISTGALSQNCSLLLDHPELSKGGIYQVQSPVSSEILLEFLTAMMTSQDISLTPDTAPGIRLLSGEFGATAFSESCDMFALSETPSRDYRADAQPATIATNMNTLLAANADLRARLAAVEKELQQVVGSNRRLLSFQTSSQSEIKRLQDELQNLSSALKGQKVDLVSMINFRATKRELEAMKGQCVHQSELAEVRSTLESLSTQTSTIIDSIGSQFEALQGIRLDIQRDLAAIRADMVIPSDLDELINSFATKEELDQLNAENQGREDRLQFLATKVGEILQGVGQSNEQLQALRQNAAWKRDMSTVVTACMASGVIGRKLVEAGWTQECIEAGTILSRPCQVA